MNKTVGKIIFCIIFLLALLIMKPTKLYAKTINSDTTIEVGETVTVDFGLAQPTGWENSDSDIVEMTYNYSGKTKTIGGKEFKIVNNAIVTGKKPGEVTITCIRKFNQGGTVKTQTREIEITVVKSQKQEKQELEQEKQELEQKVQETDKTLVDMNNADKTIPDANASAIEIVRFLRSCAYHNQLNKLKEVDKDVAEKWRDQVELEMIDQATRDGYQATFNTLDEYIKEGKVDSYQKVLANQMSQAIGETQNTQEEYKDKILAIKTELGEDRTNTTFTDVLDNMNSYIPEDDNSGTTELEKKASIILTIITNIGMILAVLMCAIIGIKYMLGSIEEKAEYKKDMIPYLVGAFLLFGICTIVKVLQQIGQSINNI